MIEKDKLPKGWRMVRLGDFATTQKGKKPKRVAKEKTKECSVPYINIKAFEKNIIDEYTDGVGCVLCEEDDFLMVWDGSRSGYVGKAIKGALGSTLVKITFPEINHDYAYYFLQSKYVEINTRAKGVGIPHVDPNILWNYNLLLPPLPEQEKIVAKIEELFSELDKGKEQLQTALQQLKVYRQAVLKYAFEGKLTNTNVKDGELPEGWKMTLLEDIIDEIEAGKSFKCDERPPLKNEFGVLKVSAVSWGKYDENESKTVLDKSRINESYIVKNGDFLISRANTLDLVGAVVIVGNTTKNLMLSDKTLRLNFNNKINSLYILYYLRSQQGRKQIQYYSTGNQESMRNIGQKGIKSISCPLPHLIEQQQIVAEIERRLSVCDKIEETINQALTQTETLRQSILKKAFEGRLVSMEDAVMKQPALSRFTLLQLAACYVEIMGKQKKPVKQGAVGVIKGLYLGDRLEGAKTHVDFANHNYGPFAKAIYDVLDDTRYFKKNRGVYQLNIKYKDLFKGIDKKDVEQLEAAYLGIHEIISKYDYKDRTFKEELLATVCKVVEDIKTTDLKAVRKQMKHWKIDLANFKNKAEKFTEKETADCLKFIINRGWDKKLLSI